MDTNIISGKLVGEKIRTELAGDVAKLKKANIVPGLAVILVGNDPASRVYVTSKAKACEKIGIYSVVLELPEFISEQNLLAEIDKLNNDPRIHGILVQLPLPKHINEHSVIERILPEKDVDGFHPINIGRLQIGQDSFVPCTPYGIIELVKSSGLEIAGKHVVVIGRSNIVGKPVGQLFLREHATVTYCHSKTKNMKELAKLADILVVAIGKPNFITRDFVKDGATVIDVGINRLDNGKLCGDVAFDDVKEVAAAITPVPGGVGPMTITMLLKNTILSAERTATKQMEYMRNE